MIDHKDFLVQTFKGYSRGYAVSEFLIIFWKKLNYVLPKWQASYLPRGGGTEMGFKFLSDDLAIEPSSVVPSPGKV